LIATAYSVSHDLRAPIRHIAGFTELLQKHADPVLDDKSRRHVRMVLDSANRMGSLVDDLLAVSRSQQSGNAKNNHQSRDCLALRFATTVPHTIRLFG
jgi:light-regulated signal transduction histidine kinase (bacteriophytochrome)